ncbi:hypothetical protein GJQ57_23185 [Ralstonia pickettii]|uniref:Uncharacterized protein n=1 Tax=Ralstonia pickettii TaxID=329 RepID=A0A7X2HS45_RALPI|nr:hypothetical protein [Ralstonia pickettii]MRT01552.1 hypothetical protein [Ralstonia pickettii]
MPTLSAAGQLPRLSFLPACSDLRRFAGTLPVVYDWSFNENTVPLGIRALGKDWFEKNLALKTALHEAWLNSTDGDRRRICDWYIQTWGGIRRNTEENLCLYGTGDEESILARGVRGMASWSKALTIRNPNTFAIADARTCISLNAIQLLADAPDIRIFPSLPSRNSRVPRAQRVVSRLRAERKLRSVESRGCYLKYNKLLIDVANAVGRGVTNQMVEMLLFAQADKLSEDLINRHAYPDSY